MYEIPSLRVRDKIFISSINPGLHNMKHISEYLNNCQSAKMKNKINMITAYKINERHLGILPIDIY